jgi:hypothetical protein
MLKSNRYGDERNHFDSSAMRETVLVVVLATPKGARMKIKSFEFLLHVCNYKTCEISFLIRLQFDFVLTRLEFIVCMYTTVIVFLDQVLNDYAVFFAHHLIDDTAMLCIHILYIACSVLERAIIQPDWPLIDFEFDP